MKKPIPSAAARALLFTALLAGLPAASRADAETDALERTAAGDLDGAVAAYDRALRAKPEDRELMIARARIRSLLDARKALDAETNPVRLKRAGRRLHDYHHIHGLHEKALSAEKALFARLPCDETAALLADTQLRMGRSADAIATFGDAKVGRADPLARALYGVALAREGSRAEAQSLLDGLAKQEELTPELCLSMAQLHAALGHNAKTAELLTLLFESTFKDRLPSLKDSVRTCPDFREALKEVGVQTAMAAESKVSGCSGNCASCPSRGK